MLDMQREKSDPEPAGGPDRTFDLSSAVYKNLQFTGCFFSGDQGTISFLHSPWL